jgi:hypothetical protein
MKFSHILPFLSATEYDEIIDQLVDGSIELNPTMLLPFLNDSQLEKLYHAAKSKKINLSIVAMCPFLPETILTQMVDDYINGGLEHDLLDGILPFLPESSIKKLFYYELQRQKNKPTE